MFVEYEWAGQTRIRATSLLEGGFRGKTFVLLNVGDISPQVVSNFGEQEASAQNTRVPPSRGVSSASFSHVFFARSSLSHVEIREILPV